MKTMKNNRSNKTSIAKLKNRNIAAEAFFRGTQGISIENALAETHSDFESLKARTGRDAQDEIKRMESEIEVNLKLKDNAEADWNIWKEKTDGIAPHFFKFFGLVLTGFLMLGGETLLLQRIADVFGVAEPAYQFAMVGVIVLLLATLTDSVVWFWKKEFNRIAVYIYGGVILAGLISLGVYRAFILEVLEAEGDAVLTRLYDDTYFLNQFVMFFLTAGLPIGATFAFEYGWHGLRRWKEWRKARRDTDRFDKLYKISVKQHEAVDEKLNKTLVEIEETRKSWQEVQQQAHAEGSRIKARRRPFWEIATLLIGSSLLILFVVMFISYLAVDPILIESIESDIARFSLYALFVVGLCSIFIYFIIKRWNSPTPERLYSQRTAVWHEAKPKFQIIEEKSDLLAESDFPTEISEKPIPDKFAQSI